MKISVIIPVHNLGEEIKQCLNSVAVQDFNKLDYEIILVLDACTDNSDEIVREWRSLHKNINLHVLYSLCGNPGGARNVGLENANGEYIIFIDGDDYLINNSALTILYDAVQSHNAVRVMDHEITGRSLKFSNRLTIWLHFFSHELIGNERFTDMLLCEDYEFVNRIRNKPEYNEAVITVPLYCYNYDKKRMVKRIKDVMKATFERNQQGLPPLYVSDAFIPRS